jgi:hypothetical protein
MSAAEIAVRMVTALLFLLAGSAVLLPALGDRRGLLAAAVLVAVGTVSFTVAVRWPYVREGGKR